MAAAKITILQNGPLLIEADTPLVDDGGTDLNTPDGKPYALCRCGESSSKPFCDGAHKAAGFDGTLAGS